MRTLWNPSRCCCATGPPCDTPPHACFNVGWECCQEALTATLDISHDGEPFGTLTLTKPGPMVCLDLTGLPIGDPIDYVATIPGHPTLTGTLIVPGCGQTVVVNPTYHVPDLIPSSLNATVHGPDAIVGGGGTWAGTLAYQGWVGGDEYMTGYRWTANVQTGSFWRVHNDPVWRCLRKNAGGTCGQPYGGVSGGDKPAIGRESWSRSKKQLYDYTQIMLIIRNPDYPNLGNHPCSVIFAWQNRVTGQPIGAGGSEFCGDEDVCPCGYWSQDEIDAMNASTTIPKLWIPPHAELPGDEIVPVHMFPTFAFNGSYGTFDGATQLAASCVPDWHGTFGDFPNCYGSGGTVHITA